MDGLCRQSRTRRGPYLSSHQPNLPSRRLAHQFKDRNSTERLFTRKSTPKRLRPCASVRIALCADDGRRRISCLRKSIASLPYAKIAETPVIPSSLAVLASPSQVCNVDGDHAGTLARALKRADELGKENAKLIVFPELFMTSANPTAAQAKQSAKETAKVLKSMGPIAKRWGSHIVLDLVEEDAGAFYHTVFVIGAKGDVIGRYRKVHLTSKERDWAQPGEDYCVLELPFGNLGLTSGHESLLF